MRGIKIGLACLSLVYLSVNQIFSQDFAKVDRVVIDAGHGGKDPGALGKHSKEKEIALAVSLKLGALIQEHLSDVKVSYTRDTDKFVELYKRAKIANDAKADLFISIHCNAVDGKSAYGTETFVLGMHKSEKNLAVAQKENAAILLEADYTTNYQNFDPNSPESYIIFQIIQATYRNQSIDIAGKIQDQFRERVNRRDRGVKEAGFLVLVNATMPSILIELGFLSNPEEEKFLMSEQGQDYMASAIFRAFRDYKESIEAAAKTNESTSVDPTMVNGQSESQESDANASTGEVYFGIQFSTRAQKVDVSKDFKGVSDVWFYEQKGLFKYVSGKYSSYDAANKNAKSIKQKGYKDAFVVSFINGERVSRSEAEAKIKEDK